MFSKILIANRGEIACRVIKTARRMGIKSVVVYSDADKDSLAVDMADQAVHIGPPQAAQSYLVIDKIIDAVKRSGAEAVHPGYGFLSENAAFAERLAKEGIAFIGPNVGAIRAMGDKIESKKFANKAKVSTVPGNLDTVESPEQAVAEAERIGYPVMIKASAGGGGKGMRVAYNAAEAREGFTSSRNEARSSFGDDRIFIEKFITEPRHIEIQVLGDKHGNVIYVGERECSVQRRNQKVIEEAPSPFVDPAMRKAMGEQAVALAKAVNYESAGTVEFIVGADKGFYFLEMNTRLQVEHPVTELVTGIDLVEQMIRVAAGEKLAIKQSDVKIDGWAIESRIYAEDPYRNFLPSIGRLVRCRPPKEVREPTRVVRNDTGVVEGSEISMYYDPMISKLCTWGRTRIEAIDHQLEALDAFELAGIEHNIPFLEAVYAQERFREGRLTTAYIKEEFPDGFHGAELVPATLVKLGLLAAFCEFKDAARKAHVSGRLFPPPKALRENWVIGIGALERPVHIVPHGEGELKIAVHSAEGDRVESTHVITSAWVPGLGLFEGKIDGHPIIAKVAPALDGWDVAYRGAKLRARLMTPARARFQALMPEKLPPDTSKFLLCPMPGLVVAINVAEGQEVKAGEALAVVEAMKMENVLRAERDATVKALKAKPGDSLAVDAVIMEFA